MSDNKHVIMVVDDDDMNLKMAKYILEKEVEADIVLANSGYTCIELLQQQVKPDLILLDIQMPRMDGIKTLEMIRGRDEWKKIPVIFLTATADKNTVIQAGRLKVDDYIKKPFLPHDLVERVNKVFALKAMDDPNLVAIMAELEKLGK